MSLTLQEVEHIARLARLELSEEQKTLYREQLEAILDHFVRLQKLDTKEVPPTASVAVAEMPLRIDESHPGLPTEAVLKNAPKTEEGQFKIPPVFE